LLQHDASFLLAEPNLTLKPQTPKERFHLLRDFLGDSRNAHHAHTSDFTRIAKRLKFNGLIESVVDVEE
jgi:hypothetical protein